MPNLPAIEHTPVKDDQPEPAPAIDQLADHRAPGDKQQQSPIEPPEPEPTPAPRHNDPTIAAMLARALADPTSLKMVDPKIKLRPPRAPRFS